MNKVSFGIDIGGTNIRMALVSMSGEVIASKMISGTSHLNPTDLTTLVADNLQSMNGTQMPVGIGIGLPGTVFKDGEMRDNMTNLPGLANYPIAGMIENATGLGCRVENDAKAAMRAEARFGAAKGIENAVCLTLGTGIGSGLLLNGKIRDGAHGSGGEVGLFRVFDGDKIHALEDLASPGGLLHRTKVSANELIAAANAGDRESEKLMNEVYDLLGQTITNLHLLLDLEIVVLCGGLAESGQVLVDNVQKAFIKHCPVPYQFNLGIYLSGLGKFSGAIGAASLWFQDIEQHSVGNTCN